MSKGSSYWGTATGKIGNTVVAIVNGQRIERAYQPNVNNPRTKRQMHQRQKFATAVKFYKRATQNFFKFAFEDKKQTESDYNAFMRYNAKKGMANFKDESRNQFFPALGIDWQLTAGTMPSPDNVHYSSLNKPQVSVNGATSTTTTLGALSTLLVSHYGLAEGDIVTLVQVTSTAMSLTDIPEYLPEWKNIQFKVDTTSTKLLTAIDSSLVCATGLLQWGTTWDLVSGIACIFSRVTTDGLRVSNSFMVNNEHANSIITASENAATQNAIDISWGTADEAILEGALVQ